jgi:phosphate transport system permease protein
MAATATTPTRRTRAKDSSRSWPLRDRMWLWACWGAGISLCVVAGSLLLYMFYEGITQLTPKLLLTHPRSSVDQSHAGGILDPILSTLLLTLLGILIAAPMGVALAVWLTEFGRPSALARAVESCVEIIAGTPSIVLAIFGQILFTQSWLSFFSFQVAGGGVYGSSFLIAGIVISLIALPMVMASTREALQAVPRHVREASFALGKTRTATVRRVLLPSVRPGIATGTVLGMGRIVGDTAIVILLLGATTRISGYGSTPILSTLRGTGSTLTSYIYNNSPAGEGNAPQKAYAAAFVLLILVLALNLSVDLIAGGRFKGRRRLIFGRPGS